MIALKIIQGGNKMKNKQKTLEIRRAREAKELRQYFFGSILPEEEKTAFFSFEITREYSPISY